MDYFKCLIIQKYLVLFSFYYTFDIKENDHNNQKIFVIFPTKLILELQFEWQFVKYLRKNGKKESSESAHYRFQEDL